MTLQTTSETSRLLDLLRPPEPPKPPRTVWGAQPRQSHALSCPAFELFFGGARGGGKTDYLLADYAQDVPAYGRDWKGILFRKTYPELEDIISRSYELYPYIFPGAKYSISQKTWYFPNGARLRFRHAETEDDVSKYQGHAYPWIGFDELPNWKDDLVYMKMFGCCRGHPAARIRSTGNPGGVGTLWVKARFIDFGKPWKLNVVKIPAMQDPVTGKWSKEAEFTRTFIPSRLEDNPALTDVDPMYEARLRMLPPHLLEMWRWGRWDIIAGAIFDIWSEKRHVVEPFMIPKAWDIYRSMDWGSYKPFSIGWWGVDHEGRCWRVAEWYGWNGHPNQGQRMTSMKVAETALEFEEKKFGKDRVKAGPADPACWNKVDDAYPSVAESMAQVGLYFVRGNNDRLNGLQECYNRLKWHPELEQETQGGRRAKWRDTRPGVMVFSNCKHFIRTIPTLTPDEKKPEDVDTDLEDHVYDEWRYFMMFCKNMRSHRQKELDFRRMQAGGPVH